VLSDAETQQQLASVLYTLDGSGRVQIESKEAALKRVFIRGAHRDV
jgi:hypothetical protein